MAVASHQRLQTCQRMTPCTKTEVADRLHKTNIVFLSTHLIRSSCHHLLTAVISHLLLCSTIPLLQLVAQVSCMCFCSIAAYSWRPSQGFGAVNVWCMVHLYSLIRVYFPSCPILTQCITRFNCQANYYA
jgi:hypothetical protein